MHTQSPILDCKKLRAFTQRLLGFKYVRTIIQIHDLLKNLTTIINKRYSIRKAFKTKYSLGCLDLFQLQHLQLSDILFSMGNIEKTPQTAPTKPAQIKPLPIYRSETNQKPTFQSELVKISPIVFTDDEEPQPEEIDQVQVQQMRCKSIEQVRVKWNSFVKIREGNFMLEYELIKLIGRGGYGSVYKVKGRYNNIIRAAKKIKKSQLSPYQQQRLFIQVSILQSLDHPNIIKLFEVYEEKDLYVIITQLCEGGELFKKISKKKLQPRQVTKITRQLLEVITYIHSRSIVHRDIKPENILISKETGNIKVIDFGIAQVMKNDDFMTARIGTIYYIAPQVLTKKYKEKCDVWSAGVVLYMMIFGNPPFNGNTEDEIINSILNQQISYQGKLWRDLPKGCKQLLVNMLQKNPNKRFNARDTLTNSWLTQEEPSYSHFVNLSAKNMAHFGFRNRLEAVVYTYCISQLLSVPQKRNLQVIFKKCDTDFDGVISLLEFKSIMREHIKDEYRLKTIMRLIDLDDSGNIQYTEFLVAVTNPKQSLKIQHYEKAFDYFDCDHSGGINYQEVAKFLQGNQSTDKIKAIFSEIDSNGDGNISRQQFLSLFLKQAARSNENDSQLARNEVLMASSRHKNTCIKNTE